MMKNKLFILINVFGMGVAIAQCIVGYFAFEYDSTFDHVHKQRDHIYRVTSVREFENKFTRYGYAPFPLGDIIDKTFPDVNQSARYYHSWSNFKLDNDLFPANLSYVDPEFFKLFSFDFVVGSAASLDDKTSLLVSEEMAVRFFGKATEALGKTITQVYGQDKKELRVAGVFKDPPMNSSFYKAAGSSYMNFENYKDEHKEIRDDDWKAQNTLFIQVDDPGRVRNVYLQLQAFVENNNKVREDFQVKEFALDPLKSMAHLDRSEDGRKETWSAPPISAVIGSNVSAILILMLACFNLTNTSISISSRRLKEIGIRKVMGSSRKNLIFQYIGETLIICALALLVAIVLADFMTRGWNFMWEYFRLTPHYSDNPSFLFFLAGTLIFTAVAAGSYPAFYISRFEPATILKGTQKFGGTNFFTRILLGLQFSISLISIVSAIGFMQNAQYQRAYDLGFDGRGAIISWLANKGEFETYRNALQSNPAITSMAGAQSGIFSNRVNDPVKYKSKQLEADIIEVGDNYLKTMNLRLLKGRDFMKDSETDRNESVIVTQKLATLFGWDEPIGKEILWKDSVKLYVIGVIKDVYTVGVWREMEPMVIRYVLPEQYTQLVASTNVTQVSAVNEFMKKEWSKIFPNQLYNGRMLQENMVQVDEVNINIVYMFAFMGLVTLLLSATGLFTLVSLNIVKRTKEIGIRKALGASVANIARIINTEFIIILLLASIAGSWAGYLQSDMIMKSIWKYYQGPNTLTFVISISLLFVVSLVSIGYKIFKAATLNPVYSLRDE